MRIGIVLFGHLRSYRQTHSSFELLKQTLQQAGEVDLFCHTWDIEESVTASWWKEHLVNEPPPPTVTALQIEEAFHPVKYTIEPSRLFDDSGYKINSSIPVAGILSMLYSQQQAFDLLKQQEQQNGFEYDVVVKTRYDLLYEIASDFDEIVKTVKTREVVYLPSSNPYELIGSSSDIFVIGSRQQIEKYFSFCINFKEAVALYNDKGYGLLIPEFCMTVYLESIGLKKEELIGLRLNILRMNGEKFQINSDKNFPDNSPLCFYSGTIDVCKKIATGDPGSINKNADRLVKKYVSWLYPEAMTNLIDSYADFYQGKWIGSDGIKRLATKASGNKLFEQGVMKNFFEEAMKNGQYGRVKKFLLANILRRNGGYGTFFFRVLKNTIFKKRSNGT